VRVLPWFRRVRGESSGNIRAPFAEFLSKSVQFVNDMLRQPHKEDHEKGEMKGNEFKDEEYLDDQDEAFEIERMQFVTS
jgi:hypothetical protein